MANLSLQDVSKTYAGGVSVVDRVSLEVPEGCFCVLLGPSGCGKSTLLRMIAGIETVTGGSILLDGQKINEWRPSERDVAMVFQSYALYPHLTVAENIAFPLRMRGVAKQEITSKVSEAVRMLQLGELVDRRPSQLSGGQRQRVALARAVVREPRVFLFDEPLSNLDAAMRLRTRGEIRQLHQRLRVSSVYVTHDQEEAMALADLVGVMAHGKLQQVAPPLDIYERPANRFVAGFVGSPPMNFVEAQLIEAQGTLTLKAPIGITASVQMKASTRPASSPVVLGIRPTAISIVDPSAGALPNSANIAARIEAIEPLGEHMDVALRCGSERLVARVPASRGLAIGHAVVMALDLSRAHIFEPGPLGARLEASLGSQSKAVLSDTLTDTRSVPNAPIHAVLS